MPAKSKAQQRFMGMVHAYQKGELKDAPDSVKKAAHSMTKKSSKDFARTKHEGLPAKVGESLSIRLKLPKRFGTGEAFMGYVYDKWPSRKTHVEMQGGDDWMAFIDGDSIIKAASYSGSNKLVSWLRRDPDDPDEFEEINEGRSLKARKIRRLLGPGKTDMERGNWWFHHSMDPKEAKARLDKAGIKHSHLKTRQGHQVAVGYMEDEETIPKRGSSEYHNLTKKRQAAYRKMNSFVNRVDKQKEYEQARKEFEAFSDIWGTIEDEETSKQKVYLSHTKDGKQGLFTKGTLALPLSSDEATPEKAREVAKRNGFEFVEDFKNLSFKDYLKLDEAMFGQATPEKQLQSLVVQLAKIVQRDPKKGLAAVVAKSAAPDQSPSELASAKDILGSAGNIAHQESFHEGILGTIGKGIAGAALNYAQQQNPAPAFMQMAVAATQNQKTSGKGRGLQAGKASPEVRIAYDIRALMIQLKQHPINDVNKLLQNVLPQAAPELLARVKNIIVGA